jgi:hypothetical protein
MNKLKIFQNLTCLLLLVLLLAQIVLLPACKTTKKAEALNQKVELIENDTTSNEDSTKYELIVLDPKFESWLALQPPANFYSRQYYENWNQRYVIEWNQRHDDPIRYGDFYETRINYDSWIDYGLELNYRLYNYFRFIEKEYGIILVRRRE